MTYPVGLSTTKIYEKNFTFGQIGMDLLLCCNLFVLCNYIKAKERWGVLWKSLKTNFAAIKKRSQYVNDFRHIE
jgi:hypothetical protein